VTQGRPRRLGGLSPTVLATILIVIGIAGGSYLALARPQAAPSTAGPTSAAQASEQPSATGTPNASPSGSPASATVGASGPIVIDPFLLKVLPASIKGAPLVENAEAEAHDLTDPALAGQASALAAALAIDTTTSDWAYVSVVHLRVGVFSDPYFKSWRETFDSGACSQAGGVAQSSAETEIAGHKTFIGHCVGGVLTYHVHLLPGDVIVSISALGSQRFGQLVVQGLR
jgi:hypothetical protein